MQNLHFHLELFQCTVYLSLKIWQKNLVLEAFRLIFFPHFKNHFLELRTEYRRLAYNKFFVGPAWLRRTLSFGIFSRAQTTYYRWCIWLLRNPDETWYWNSVNKIINRKSPNKKTLGLGRCFNVYLAPSYLQIFGFENNTFISY